MTAPPEQFLKEGLHHVVEMIGRLKEAKSTKEFFQLAVTLPREKLGLERTGLSILQGNTLHGTFGTSLLGDRVDESDVQYPLETIEWETRRAGEFRDGTRWFLRENSNQVNWTDPDNLDSDKRGWVVLTPLVEGDELLGCFYNDTARSDAPLDKDLQDLLAVYCSLLASLLHHRQTQKELEHQISLYDFLQREIGDGLMILDRNWEIQEANSAILEMLECAEDELKQTRLHDHVDPASLDRDFFSEDTVPRLFPQGLELQFIRRDQSRLNCEVTCVSFHDSEQDLTFMFCRDLTERNRLEQSGAHLAQQLLDVQEIERKEISSMLHDQLGQILTLIRLELQSIEPRDEESTEHLHNCTNHVIHLLEIVRGMARSLRPSILDDHPIEMAFQDLLEKFQQSTPLKITFTHRADHPSKLPPLVETNLYRILQESMQNVVRHAEATEVTVTYLNSGDGIHLMVEDNGVGMPTDQARLGSGIGLLGIQERLTRMGGTMKISSHRNRGTSIEFFIPNYDQESGNH